MSNNIEQHPVSLPPPQGYPPQGYPNGIYPPAPVYPPQPQGQGQGYAQGYPTQGVGYYPPHPQPHGYPSQLGPHSYPPPMGMGSPPQGYPPQSCHPPQYGAPPHGQGYPHQKQKQNQAATGIMGGWFTDNPRMEGVLEGWCREFNGSVVDYFTVQEGQSSGGG
ncbi:uncharacterized protein LOC132608046 [Lycium barbarum]|uniref:uncharacterized protein LOC132608046 n=1 Tax=Lycium barbarum TaxID=112863 RepID=UPI00293EBA5E|nr:uncharacterized protein LOC132608046 [Lycium barbarum]